MTRASRRVALGVAREGRLAQVAARPGDQVEAGQLLFELESEVERLELARLEILAGSTAGIELAEARRDQAEAAAERARALEARDIASGAKRLELEAEARAAAAEVQRARESVRLAVIERDQAAARLERLRGRSPFAARVEAVRHDVGESLDQLEPVVDLVALDPIHVEFPCPVADAERWPVGRAARVLSMDGVHEGIGVVTFRGRTSDVASQTVLVRVEMPNEDGLWLGGLKVRVAPAPDVTAPAPSGGNGK